jgi:hypothetical protein
MGHFSSLRQAHILAGVTLCPNEQRVNTTKVIAERSNAGHGTVTKVKKILEKSPEETIQKVRAGKQSIASAYAKIQEADKPVFY